MRHTRTVLIAAAALTVVAAAAAPALGAKACEAVGDAYPIGGGLYEYSIIITWGFLGAEIPERFDIVIAHLEDCLFYDPQSQPDYIVPGHGTSTADEGCDPDRGVLPTQIDWVGEMRFEDLDCFLPALHIAHENTGATASCLPLSDDTGVFTFASYGLPMDTETYYDVILIKAGEFCILCDYTGPLPDCNVWSPVESACWSTIKALYK